MLIENGVDVQVAVNGREGLECLVDFGPEVIILDLGMPEMDGFTFLGHLKSDPSWSKIPVVVHSGMELSSEQLEFLSDKTGAIVIKGRSSAQQLIASVLSCAAAERKKVK